MTISTNNPGNLRTTDQHWLGKVTPPGSPFEHFDTPEHGLRAMAVILKNDIKDGRDTIEDIIPRWAPPTENATDSYIDAVSDMTGFDSDTVLTADAETLAKLVSAITFRENGKNPYAADAITQAVKDALT